MYSSETIFWKKERSIRSVKMDNLRDIRKMDRVPNAQIRELCGVMKGVDERIEESVLQWFGHVERMENDRIAKRVYVGEIAGSYSMGRLWNSWSDTVKVC